MRKTYDAISCGVATLLLMSCAAPTSAPQATPNNAVLYPTQPNCKRLGGNSNTENAVAGSAIGAALGALVGSQTHDRNGLAKGTLIGTLAGGLAGSQYNTLIGKTELPDGSVKLNVPGSVLFRSGSAEVNAGFEQTLAAVATTLRDYCGLTAIVTGHTDNVGGSSENKRLSDRRAEAVVAVLVRLGIDASRLRAEGRSFDEPVASNVDEAGRALNRRVELIVRPPLN